MLILVSAKTIVLADTCYQNNNLTRNIGLLLFHTTQMAEPLLTDIFGAGATQNASSITILKADLPLTATANNRAEQILAALIKKAAIKLTPDNYGTNLDQSVNLAPGFDSLVYRTDTAGATTTHLQTQVAINFSKPQTSSGITPDDY